MINFALDIHMYTSSIVAESAQWLEKPLSFLVEKEAEERPLRAGSGIPLYGHISRKETHKLRSLIIMLTEKCEPPISSTWPRRNICSAKQFPFCYALCSWICLMTHRLV